MPLRKGSATVPVAAIGVPPMAQGGRATNQTVQALCAQSGRRDAGQCARDARAPPKRTESFRIGSQTSSILAGNIALIQNGGQDMIAAAVAGHAMLSAEKSRKPKE
jgi:hypothetical protein